LEEHYQSHQGHDKFIKEKKFHLGYWVLLFHSYFNMLGGSFALDVLAPYEIDILYTYGIINLHTINEDRMPLMVNSHKLRLYQNPLSIDVFLEI